MTEYEKLSLRLLSIIANGIALTVTNTCRPAEVMGHLDDVKAVGKDVTAALKKQE